MSFLPWSEVSQYPVPAGPDLAARVIPAAVSRHTDYVCQAQDPIFRISPVCRNPGTLSGRLVSWLAPSLTIAVRSQSCWKGDSVRISPAGSAVLDCTIGVNQAAETQLGRVAAWIIIPTFVLMLAGQTKNPVFQAIFPIVMVSFALPSLALSMFAQLLLARQKKVYAAIIKDITDRLSDPEP